MHSGPAPASLPPAGAAAVEEAVLISKGPVFTEYPVKVVW
jgi:hypothetical protein